MALTRGQAVTRLAATLSELLTGSGVAASDSVGGLKEPIDDALRDLGVLESALTADPVVGDTQVRAFLSLAEYYALVRVRYAVTLSSIDVRVEDEGDLKRSQRIKALDTLIEQRQKAAEPYGLGSGGSFGYGSLTLDRYEPSGV